MGYEDDQQAQQQDDEAQQQLALDCLIVIHKHGHEGTADTLAPLLGINNLWQQTKNDLAKRRIASVG